MISFAVCFNWFNLIFSSMHHHCSENKVQIVMQIAVLNSVTRIVKSTSYLLYVQLMTSLEYIHASHRVRLDLTFNTWAQSCIALIIMRVTTGECSNQVRVTFLDIDREIQLIYTNFQVTLASWHVLKNKLEMFKHCSFCKECTNFLNFVSHQRSHQGTG